MSGPGLRDLVSAGPIHFMGIGGAGMCALAEAVLRAGGEVTGCDLQDGPGARSLEAMGVPVERGHDPAHVTGAAALVVTAAVPTDHPEVRAARDLGIAVLKRSEALGDWVTPGRVVAVAGTHGKTTTSAMITQILSRGGLDPTAFVGGSVPGWGGNFRNGRDDLFVVEADEYDRSFHALVPDLALVTNVEADHLDVYGTLEGVRQAFRTFLEQVPPGGTVAVCGDDSEAARLLPGIGVDSFTYGLGAGCMVRATDVESDGDGSRMRVTEEGIDRGVLRVSVPGLHNVRNALGAGLVARRLGVPWETIGEVLEAFRGVGRRFERLGKARGIVVVDDYAHHPTEIGAALAAARVAYPGLRLVAAFQPHLYTRTRDFLERFGAALAEADAVWVTEVYPAREEPIPGIDGPAVAAAVRASGNEEVSFHADVATLPEALETYLRPGDLCLTLGAGSIEHTGRTLLERLRGAEVDDA